MLGIRPDHTLFGGRRTHGSSTSSRTSRSSLNAKYDRMLGSSHSIRTGRGSIETLKQVEEEKRKLDEGRQKKRDEEEQAMFKKLGIVAPNGFGSRASRSSTEVIADLQKFRLGNVKQNKTVKLSEELESILYPKAGKPKGLDAIPRYPPDPLPNDANIQDATQQQHANAAHPPWLMPHAGHVTMPYMPFSVQPPGYWAQTQAGWAFCPAFDSTQAYPGFLPWAPTFAPPVTTQINGVHSHPANMAIYPRDAYGLAVNGVAGARHETDLAPQPRGILKPSSDIMASSDPPSSSRQVRFRDTPDVAPSQQRGHTADRHVHDQHHNHCQSRARNSRTSVSHDHSPAGIPQSLKQAHSRLLIPDGAPNHTGKPSAKVLVRELERMAEEMSFTPRFPKERPHREPSHEDTEPDLDREDYNDEAPRLDDGYESSDEEPSQPDGDYTYSSPLSTHGTDSAMYQSPVKRRRYDIKPSQNPLRLDRFYPTASFGSLPSSHAQSARDYLTPSPDVLESTNDLRNDFEEPYHPSPPPNYADDDANPSQHTDDRLEPYRMSQQVIVNQEEEDMASVESSLSGQDPDYFQNYRQPAHETIPITSADKKRLRIGDPEDSTDLSYRPSSTPESDELEYEDDSSSPSASSSPPNGQPEPKRVRLNEGIWDRFEVPADKLPPPPPVKPKRRAKLLPQQQPRPRIKLEPSSQSHSQVSHIEPPYEDANGLEYQYDHEYRHADEHEVIEGSWTHSQSDRSHYRFGLPTIAEDDEEQEEGEGQQQDIITDLADSEPMRRKDWVEAMAGHRGEVGFRVWRDVY